MRPSDLFCFLPAPVGSGALFLQENWLAGLAVAVALALIGACVVVLKWLLKDIEKEGGLSGWQRTRYKLVEDRERARGLALRAREERAMTELEGKHRRREYKRGVSSWPSQLRDQLKLFR